MRAWHMHNYSYRRVKTKQDMRHAVWVGRSGVQVVANFNRSVAAKRAFAFGFTTSI